MFMHTVFLGRECFIPREESSFSMDWRQVRGCVNVEAVGHESVEYMNRRVQGPRLRHPYRWT